MKAESIEYVLNQLGGDGSYRRSGDHLMANCVHSEWGHSSGRDKDHKLGVMVADGMSPLNCFYPGCLPDNSPKTLLGLVQLVGGKRVGAGEMSPDQLSNLKAFVLMAEDEDEVSTDASWGAARPKEAIPQDIVAACNGTAPYWVSRGISVETANEWKLGELGGRALMPFLDQKGEMVAVQGRLLPGMKKDAYGWESRGHDEKYRSFPVGFERADLLMGEHLIAQPVDWLLVVESPFDAIALTDWLRRDVAAQNDILPEGSASRQWAVVATMGGEASARHAQKMVEFLAADGELVLGMDMDHAGRLATRKLIGYEPQHPGHRLFRRITRITEVEWVRKDATDTGDEENRVSADVVRADAMNALRKRVDWLDKRVRSLVG